MIAGILAPLLMRRGIHYGWVMVAVTFLCMLATAAAMGMPGVLMIPLQGEFGWSSAQVSGAMALRLVLFGAAGPFAAALMQRYGMRVTAGTALVLVMAGLALATEMTSIWQLYLFWGVMAGIGTGITAIVLGATMTNRWFLARRGLVLGLLTSAAATGQLAFLPVSAWLAQSYGWRAAVLSPIAACLVALLVLVLLGADHPGSVGLSPFGDRSAPTAPPPRTAEGAIRTAFVTLGDAAQTKLFWLLVFAFGVCGFTTNGLVQTHFIPLCLDFGLTTVAAAGVLAVMGGFDFIGSIGSGMLTDRFDARWLLFWYLGLRAVSLMLLPYSGFSFYGLSLFALFYGLDWIATVPPVVRLATDGFGRDRAGLVFGWIFAAHQIGAASAALGAGMVRDAYSSYLPAFFAGGVLCVAGAAAALVARPRLADGRAQA